MALGEWGNFVTIELQGKTETYVRIKSTKEAAKYLIEAWPGSRDAAYRDAVVACASALRGLASEKHVVEGLCKAAATSNLVAYDSVDSFEADIISAFKTSLDDDLQSHLDAAFDLLGQPDAMDGRNGNL